MYNTGLIPPFEGFLPALTIVCPIQWPLLQRPDMDIPLLMWGYYIVFNRINLYSIIK